MMDTARLKIWARLIHMGRRTLEDIPEADRDAADAVYNEMYPTLKETEDGNTDDNIEHDSGRSDAEDLCESE